MNCDLEGTPLAPSTGLVALSGGTDLRSEVVMRGRAEEQSQREQSTSFSRVIVDGEGRTWIVREMPPAIYDRRGAPSLVFVTDDVMRRVRDYPADWFQRPDAELYGLSLRR